MYFSTGRRAAGDFKHDFSGPLTIYKAVIGIIAQIAEKKDERTREAFEQLKNSNPVRAFVLAVERMKDGMDCLQTLNERTLPALKSGPLSQRPSSIITHLEPTKQALVSFVESTNFDSRTKEILLEQLRDSFSPAIRDKIARTLEYTSLSTEKHPVELGRLLEKLGPEIQVDRPTEPLHVLGVEPHLLQTLENFITNAQQHARDDVPLTIRVGLRKEQSEAVITVEDNGTGVEPKILAGLRLGTKVSGRSKQGGTGRGSQIARRIIHDHFGRWTIETHYDPKSVKKDGAWTRHTLRLPLCHPG